MDENETIEEACSGDRAALNKLLSDNYSILKGYLLKMTGDDSLARDLTQETMSKAILNIKKFHTGARFSTYLITIGTNLYRDHLRKNKRIEPLDEEIEFPGESVEDKSIKEMEYKEAMSILSAIPYEKRAAFILKYYYGYSYDEISIILKCPVGTVRSRLHYCAIYMRNEMKRRGFVR